MVMNNSRDVPDRKVHGANMGPTQVLLSPGGPYVDPMNLAIRGVAIFGSKQWFIYLNTILVHQASRLS